MEEQRVSLQQPQILERLRRVAHSTVAAKLPLVKIVTPVTAATGHRECDHAVRGLAVAGVAVQVIVGAVECKTRLGIVVEYPEEPARRIVALCTVRPEPAFVYIVLGMALHTLPWCIEEGRCFVAVFADHVSMVANQGEQREIMVEAHRFGPQHFSMTRPAVLTELIFVGVVFCVTIEAAGQW